MPTHALLCHPTSTNPAVSGIEVEATFAVDGSLALRYRIQGQPAGIRLPAPRPPAPCDQLWQHTCCEAFIAAPPSPAGANPAYREFNFSPSGQWASYGFGRYRERDPDFSPVGVPRFSLQRLPDGFVLTAALPPALLPAGASLQIALTCVIEASDGSKTYWALTHAAPQPDFHLRQSFTLTLPRPTP